MKKYHFFFTLNTLPKPGSADMINFVNCADAAAALGWRAILVYPESGPRSFNPIRWFVPFSPEPVPDKVGQFYQITGNLEAVRLPCPWPFGRIFKGRLSFAALAKKIFLPKFIFPRTELFHTRDWNLARCAIENNVPTVFYHDGYLVKEPFEAKIAQSPFLRAVITDSGALKENMIQYGMPAKKILAVCNGVNRSFLSRRPEEAEAWRKKIMKESARFMAVYAGALAKWKGVDILVDAATGLPEAQFVIAGGNDDEVKNWKERLAQKKIINVIFLGRIQHSDLVSLCQAADIVVYPHRSGGPATHTSPLKFFEYLASGTPIVAADIPFLAEFKDKGLALEICAPDSVVAFAAALRSALNRYPRRTDGYSANISFARQFTWEERMSKILKHVETLKGAGGFS